MSAERQPAERFKLMKLPEVARNKVIQSMDGPDLLIFSFCSKRMYSLAQDLSPKPKSVIAEITQDGFFSDFMYKDEDGEVDNSLSFRLAAHPYPDDRSFRFSILVGNQSLGVQINDDDDDQIQHYICDALVPAMIELTNYALKLFDKIGTSDKVLVLDTPSMSLEDKDCVLRWETFHKVSSLHFEYGTLLSSADLDALFENFKSSTDFYLTSNSLRTYELKKVISPTFALMCTPPWVITSDFVDNLINESANLCLTSVTISSELINRIIKSWVERPETPPLRYLHFVLHEDVVFDRAIVDNGLTLKTWDPSKRNGTFIMKDMMQMGTPHPFEDCPDVYRANGLIATFRLEPKCFKMVVWHEPFAKRSSLKTFTCDSCK